MGWVLGVVGIGFGFGFNEVVWRHLGLGFGSGYNRGGYGFIG